MAKNRRLIEPLINLVIQIKIALVEILVFLFFDFTRLRPGLQISIFEIISKASDFPKLVLQNCKSDMNILPPLQR